MIKGRYTPLDWCNALIASDPARLDLLCQSPEARLCVNDTYPFEINEGNLIRVEEIPSPLICAIETGVPLARIQTLVDKGGARATMTALYLTWCRRNFHLEGKQRFLFLVSRGAPHNFWTFRYHMEISATEEEKIQMIQNHLVFAKDLTTSEVYAPMFKVACQRMELARRTTVSVLGLHRKGPHFQNKDVLRIIARQVKERAHSPLWKPPPLPWWKRINPPTNDELYQGVLIFLSLLFVILYFWCILTGRGDGICYRGSMLDYLFPVAP